MRGFSRPQTDAGDEASVCEYHLSSCSALSHYRTSAAIAEEKKDGSAAWTDGSVAAPKGHALFAVDSATPKDSALGDSLAQEELRREDADADIEVRGAIRQWLLE